MSASESGPSGAMSSGRVTGPSRAMGAGNAASSALNNGTMGAGARPGVRTQSRNTGISAPGTEIGPAPGGNDVNAGRGAAGSAAAANQGNPSGAPALGTQGGGASGNAERSAETGTINAPGSAGGAPTGGSSLGGANVRGQTNGTTGARNSSHHSASDSSDSSTAGGGTAPMSGSRANTPNTVTGNLRQLLPYVLGIGVVLVGGLFGFLFWMRRPNPADPKRS